jgi:8-oxo-dGTP pyrophosphatase MutT (NUDIX family)
MADQPPKKILTLVVVSDGGRILLGMKKRGFGAGKWNGFGGKVTPGESIEAAAVRELREEAGIEAVRVDERARIVFLYGDGSERVTMNTHVFLCDAWTGEPTESDEALPRWYSHEEIPFQSMWLDDIHWLPRFLAGERFTATFRFDAAGETILSHEFGEYGDAIEGVRP